MTGVALGSFVNDLSAGTTSGKVERELYAHMRAETSSSERERLFSERAWSRERWFMVENGRYWSLSSSQRFMLQDVRRVAICSQLRHPIKAPTEVSMWKS